VLAGLFLLAAIWQRSHTEALREERAQRYGVPDSAHPRESGWSTLVLGRPSGADPLPPLEGGVAGEEPPPGEEPPTPSPTPPPAEAREYDYRYEVQGGDVLGRICARHYGTSKPALVEALARYNDLESPDDIRQGDILLLPERGKLEE